MNRYTCEARNGARPKSTNICKCDLRLSVALICLLLANAASAVPHKAAALSQSIAPPSTSHNTQLYPAYQPEQYRPSIWRVVDSPIIQPGTLNAVAAISADDVWAVGYDDTIFSSSPLSVKSLILHRDRGRWSTVRSPNPGVLNEIRGIAAVAKNDVWAVGVYYELTEERQQALILHWDGTLWSQIESPSLGSNAAGLDDVVAISANDIWAVGAYGMADGKQSFALLEHWDGTQWTIFPSPNPGSRVNGLDGVSAVSPDDVWAVGTYADYQEDGGFGAFKTLAMHWDGSKWEVVHSPNGEGYSHAYELRDVTAIARDDVWAVGSYLPDIGANVPYQMLTLHWDGSEWKVIPNAFSTQSTMLAGVTATSARDVWAVGNYCPAECDNRSGHSPMTMHWDGDRWNAEPIDVVSSDSYLSGVAVVPGVTGAEVWVVGDLKTVVDFRVQVLIAHSAPEEAAPPVVASPPAPTSEPSGNSAPGMPRTGAGMDIITLYLALLSLLGMLLLLVGVSLQGRDSHM